MILISTLFVEVHVVTIVLEYLVYALPVVHGVVIVTLVIFNMIMEPVYHQIHVTVKLFIFYGIFLNAIIHMQMKSRICLSLLYQLHLTLKACMYVEMYPIMQLSCFQISHSSRKICDCSLLFSVQSTLRLERIIKY